MLKELLGKENGDLNDLEVKEMDLFAKMDRLLIEQQDKNSIDL